MSTIDFITLEVSDTGAADRFYESLQLTDRVRTTQAAEPPPTGFRGFTLSLVLPQPADVDTLLERALEAGATSLKPASKSLWGYGAAFQSPDGAIWTLASSSKKDSGPATGEITDLVLQLGVADVAASKRFYADRGFTVAKSFGRKYAELDTGPITLTLNKRAALAKVAGVPDEGADTHGIILPSGGESFTDPDGYRFA